MARSSPSTAAGARAYWELARLILVLLAVFAWGCRSMASAADYSDRIIWWDKEKNDARFVPEAVLSSLSDEQLPFSENVREILRIEIATRASAGTEIPPILPTQRRRVVPECSSELLRPPEPGSWEHARSLVDWARSMEIVALARVVQIVPGWDGRLGSISQAVYVRIEQNLKGAGPDSFPARALVFLEPTESVVVGETRLCKILHGDPPPSRRQVGDRLLVTGAKEDGDDLLMTGSTVHRVEKGMIRFRPYFNITDLKDLPLEDFLAALKSPIQAEGEKP
ncbi:MAG TPA: hypothetical protein VF017_11405 [Thermoanaerobaculia bacterium]|nr:hypothetical protein [Thermoanaerobaculia bacterium]